MRRTQLRLDDDLYDALKAEAAADGRTLHSYMLTLFREARAARRARRLSAELALGA